MAEPTIPTEKPRIYYDDVLKHHEDVAGFYRHFEAPGVGHCAGGPGPLPNAALEQPIEWVKKGTAPEAKRAKSRSTGLRRPLWPYPARQVFVDGDGKWTSSLRCVE